MFENGLLTFDKPASAILADLDANNLLYKPDDTTVRLGGIAIEDTNLNLDTFDFLFQADNTSARLFFFENISGDFNRWIWQFSTGTFYPRMTMENHIAATGETRQFFQGLNANNDFLNSLRSDFNNIYGYVIYGDFGITLDQEIFRIDGLSTYIAIPENDAALTNQFDSSVRFSADPSVDRLTAHVRRDNSATYSFDIPLSQYDAAIYGGKTFTNISTANPFLIEDNSATPETLVEIDETIITLGDFTNHSIEVFLQLDTPQFRARAGNYDIQLTSTLARIGNNTPTDFRISSGTPEIRKSNVIYYTILDNKNYHRAEDDTVTTNQPASTVAMRIDETNDDLIFYVLYADGTTAKTGSVNLI